MCWKKSGKVPINEKNKNQPPFDKQLTNSQTTTTTTTTTTNNETSTKTFVHTHHAVLFKALYFHDSNCSSQGID
jgi:hypothetical protein